MRFRRLRQYALNYQQGVMFGGRRYMGVALALLVGGGLLLSSPLVRESRTRLFKFDTELIELTQTQHRMWGREGMCEFVLGSKKKSDMFLDTLTRNSLPNEVRPKMFQYFINNETICKTPKELSFLMAVYSTPKSFEERMRVRQTWGRQHLITSYPSKTVFFMGIVTDPNLQAVVLKESREFGDIVQANFIDTFDNLSLKALSQLQWMNQFCVDAKYLIKTHEELYVDVFQVVRVLQSITTIPRCIVGRVRRPPAVLRGDIKAILALNEMEEQKHSPLYCSGWIYILTHSVLAEMYKIAMQTPVFHIDNIYMTGVLAAQLPNFAYIDFYGRYPQGKYVAVQPGFGRPCNAACKFKLWCDHLFHLNPDDIESLGIRKYSMILRELNCDEVSIL